jgi:hypothetical protein
MCSKQTEDPIELLKAIQLELHDSVDNSIMLRLSNVIAMLEAKGDDIDRKQMFGHIVTVIELIVIVHDLIRISSQTSP